MLKRSSAQRRAQPSHVVSRMRPVANTYNPQHRTFEVVLATAAPVDRGNFLEVLDVAGADWPESLPLQLDHVLSVENTIGRVENIRVENGQLIGRARLSQGADLDWLASRIEDGTITSLSVGYRVARWQNRNGERGSKPLRTAIAWTLVEASLVVDPADPAARVRSKGKVMEDEVIETEETAAETAAESASSADVTIIRRTAEALNLGADVLSRSNDGDDEPETENERAAAVAALRQRTAPARRTATRHNAETLDNPSAFRRAMTGAIVARMTGEEPQGAARQLAGLEWDEMHRSYARSMGIQTTGLSRVDLFTRLLATSDMPQIAGEAVNMNVRREYEAAASPITALFGSRSLQDFRPQNDVIVDWTTLKVDRVAETGEFKTSAVTDDGEPVRLYTLGGITSVSRQLYINGAGALANLSGSQGRRLAADEADRAVAFIEQASHAGPTMRDGTAVFHGDRNNIATLDTTSLATIVTSLMTARAAMSKRKGRGDVIVGVFPAYWIVAPEFEETALKAVATVQASAIADVNPLAGKLQVVVEPRLSATDKSWLSANPSQIDGLVKATLEGQPGPMTESRWGFEIDALQFKIRHDLGHAFVEWRGWTRLDHAAVG